MKIAIMRLKSKYTALTTKEKKKLRLQIFVGILFFMVFKAVFADWEHFKAGFTGHF
jgi:hypothetical protein